MDNFSKIISVTPSYLERCQSVVKKKKVSIFVSIPITANWRNALFWKLKLRCISLLNKNG